MGGREEGRQTSCFSSILFQVFYHAINLHLKYMCQCDVLLFSGDLFPQQNATWHEWTHVAYSVCLKKPALFLVFHHYTNNFNIHDSLAFVPQARALPPFFCLPPPPLFQYLLPFVLFCVLQPLNHTPVARQFVLRGAERGTWEGSVSPSRGASAYFTRREQQPLSTAGEITERSLQGRSMRQNIFLELSGSI